MTFSKKKLSIYVNLALVLLLLFSYFSVYISPATISFLAIFGLIYPILLILNFVFVIYWIFRKKYYFLVSLVVILLGWNQFGNFFQLNIKKNSEIKGIKVISYNVRLFNKWGWSSDKKVKNKILNFFKQESPDILCIQEYYNNRKYRIGIFNTKKKYNHIEYSVNKKRKGNSGIATFSTYPIVGKGKINITKKTNICIFTDIKINKDTIRVYNVHLASIHLGYSDYKFINNRGKNTNIFKEVNSITKKLLNAYSKRANQANIIANHIKKSPHKVIVCGDFNDTPNSYTYRKMRNKLNDAFIESGNGTGYTYVRKFAPFRIDFILHSKKIKSYNFKTHNIELSDHYPIMCIIDV